MDRYIDKDSDYDYIIRFAHFGNSLVHFWLILHFLFFYDPYVYDFNKKWSRKIFDMTR